jgi:hypothetical protein
MTIPLVPPVAEAVAEVGVDADRGLSTSNDMMQPAAAGQLMVPPVMALPATLKKIRSLFVLVLLNSVIGEQPTLEVVSVGPTLGVPITLPVIGIPHNALTEPLVLHTYKFPEVPDVL